MAEWSPPLLLFFVANTRPTIWDDESDLIRKLYLTLKDGVHLNASDSTPDVTYRPGDVRHTYVMWKKTLQKLNGRLKYSQEE